MKPDNRDEQCNCKVGYQENNGSCIKGKCSDGDLVCSGGGICRIFDNV